MYCPRCGIEAKTERGLRKHMTGQKKYGGHELSPIEAEREAAQAAGNSGSNVRPKTVAPVSSQVIYRDFQSRETLKPKPASAYPPSDNPFELFLQETFESLVQNKKTPKYQFERRIDAILNSFLPEILLELYGWHTEVIAPEFPLKKEDNNQSTNVDYLLFRHSNNRAQKAWVFFELKTDDGSIRSGQVDVYINAMQLGMPRLYRDLEQIAKASKEKKKYIELLSRFDSRQLDIPIELVYLSPSQLHTNTPGIHLISFSELQHIELQRHGQVWKMFKTIVLPALL
jgi:hypothetical protein